MHIYNIMMEECKRLQDCQISYINNQVVDLNYQDISINIISHNPVIISCSCDNLVLATIEFNQNRVKMRTYLNLSKKLKRTLIKRAYVLYESFKNPSNVIIPRRKSTRRKISLQELLTFEKR